MNQLYSLMTCFRHITFGPPPPPQKNTYLNVFLILSGDPGAVSPVEGIFVGES